MARRTPPCLPWILDAFQRGLGRWGRTADAVEADAVGSDLGRAGIDEAALAAQEAAFARAFAAGDPRLARGLYHPEVVYLSPTVRLFGWPRRIDGVERTLEFIALTIRRCAAIEYRALEQVIVPGGEVAFVRVAFDWTHAGRRLRSTYVVRYHYRDGLVAEQELYYDPSAPPEELAWGRN